jgi:hypothetical protein
LLYSVFSWNIGFIQGRLDIFLISVYTHIRMNKGKECGKMQFRKFSFVFRLNDVFLHFFGRSVNRMMSHKKVKTNSVALQ